MTCWFRLIFDHRCYIHLLMILLCIAISFSAQDKKAVPDANRRRAMEPATLHGGLLLQLLLLLLLLLSCAHTEVERMYVCTKKLQDNFRSRSGTRTKFQCCWLLLPRAAPSSTSSPRWSSWPPWWPTWDQPGDLCDHKGHKDHHCEGQDQQRR